MQVSFYLVNPFNDVFEALFSYIAQFVLLNIIVSEKLRKEWTMTGQHEFACIKLGTIFKKNFDISKVLRIC